MKDKLLDTTLLIDLSRGYAAAADFVDNERHFKMISGLIVYAPYH